MKRHSPEIHFKLLDFQDAFAAIITATSEGRQIVPLLGAGISSESGIPTSYRLGEYLAKVRHLSQLVETEPTAIRASPVLWSTSDGWPELFELTPLLLNVLRRCGHLKDRHDGRVLYDIIDGQLCDELSSVFQSRLDTIWAAIEPARERILHSLLTQWRTLLRGLTSGQLADVDALFDTITRWAVPNRGHVFAAHLANLMGWRLILTTNFDSLLESALTYLGLNYNEYVLPDIGPIQEPSIVRSTPTVLKLLGGKSSVRLRDVPDSEIDIDSQRRFLNYLDDDALLLVLGYRGTDRRVMSLLRGHLERFVSTDSNAVALLWISREAPAPELTSQFGHSQKRSAIATASFSNTGLFLQELSARLRPSFPCSAVPYSPVPHLMPPTWSVSAPPIAKDYDTSLLATAALSDSHTVSLPVIAIDARSSGEGASTMLADLARACERTHDVIWCDLEEFPNADALLAHVQQQIMQHDPSLPPLIMNGVSDSFLTYDPSREGSLHGQHQPAVSRLLRALRRGKYFVAIDSMNEFGRTEVGHDLSEPSDNITAEYARVCHLLVCLARQGDRLGESRLAFVLSAPQLRGACADAARTTMTTAQDDSFVDSGASEPTSPVPRRRAIRNGKFLLDGKFQVLRLCGEGSFGHVYKVLDVTLQTVRAAKVLRKHRRTAQQLIAEAQKASNLTHPNIAQVFLAEVDDKGKVIIIGEYIAGRTLDQVEAALDLLTKVRIVSAIAKALHYAHTTAKVVHRDVKLSNIMVTSDGIPKLVDFGMAAYVDSKEMARPGGTPWYMAPENFEPSLGHIDHRADVFSLGVVLFRLLAGCFPFSHDNSTDLQRAICSAPTPNLRDLVPQVSENLAAICWKCLEKRPSDRYGSGEELAKALDAFLDSTSSGDVVQSQLRNTCDATRLALQGLSREPGSPLEVRTATRHREFNYRASHDAIGPVVKDDNDSLSLGMQIVGMGNATTAPVSVLWPRLRFDHQALLILASTFRRPRSLVAMKRLGESLLSLNQSGEEKWAPSILKAFSRWAVDAGNAGSPLFPAEESDQQRRIKDRVDRVLNDLHNAALLLRQEGGFYWMHSDVRDFVYIKALESEPEGVGSLHAAIASFYYDMVYQSTRDVLAFREFVAHQVLAVRYADSAQVQAAGMQRLLSCIERERFHLLANAHPSVILGWVNAIRDHELARVELRRWPDTDVHADKKRVSLVGEARALLCDLAAEVYRRTTDYEACIETRLEQITHRMRDLGKPCSGEWLKEQISSLRRRAFKSVKEYVHQQLTEACVLEHLEERMKRRACKRLLEHVYEIAVCLGGLHQHGVSKALFEELASIADQIVTVKGKRQHPPLSSSVQESALVLRCRSSIRIMDALSAEVYTWDDVSKREESLNELLREYPRAMNCLERYPASYSAAHARHSCNVRVLVARAHYLQRRFTQAHLVLDSAIASVAGATSSVGRTAHAECELRRAECLFLEADQLAREHRLDSDARRARAEQCLSLAKASLEKARDLLKSERGSVWRWTLLFLEETQLRHERMALTFLGAMPLDTDNCRVRWRMAREALGSLASGVDNIAKDNRRWMLFEVLWWQIYICADFACPFTGHGFDRVWRDLNEDAGLGWYYERQDGNRGRWLPMLIGECGQRNIKSLTAKWERHGGGADPTLRDWIIDLQKRIIAQRAHRT